MVSDSFTFIINGTEIVVDLDQALVLSPTVHEQLGTDFSMRMFTIEDPDINPTDFEYLQKLIAGEPFTFRRDMRCSLITLCRRIGNVEFEQLLFSLTFALNSSPTGELVVDLWDFASSSQPLGVDPSTFYKYTTDDLSVLGLSTLDDILSSDSLRLESEDKLVRTLFDLGRDYAALFQHVRFEFLSPRGLADFAEHFDYAALTREIWEHLVLRLRGVRDAEIESRRFAGGLTPAPDRSSGLPPPPERVAVFQPPPERPGGFAPMSERDPAHDRGIPGMPPPPRAAYGPPPFIPRDGPVLRAPPSMPASAFSPAAVGPGGFGPGGFAPGAVGQAVAQPVAQPVGQPVGQPALPTLPPLPPAAPPGLESKVVAALPGLESKIVAAPPAILAAVGGRRASLIYRGSHDGFAAKSFHDACDGHKNTVVIVETREGWIFGGYSPCEWDSSYKYKQDDTRTSFLFTIKNPHGVAPTVFPLKEDRKQCAIYSFPSRGPIFGGGCDLFVSDNCDANNKSYTRGFGDTYENTTKLDGRTFFTGDRNFVVKEIEVFEISE
jgi:hypothetical protein